MFEIVVNISALLGAFLGITLSILRISDWRRDRACVKIDLEPVWELNEERKITRSHLSLRITNVGRRPVTIQSVNVKLGDPKVYSPHIDPDKATLTEAQVLYLKNIAVGIEKGIDAVNVRDSFGRVWYPTRKKLARWNRQIADNQIGCTPKRMMGITSEITKESLYYGERGDIPQR